MSRHKHHKKKGAGAAPFHGRVEKTFSTNEEVYVVPTEQLGQPKLSVRVMEIAKTWLNDAEDIHDMRSYLGLAVFAWNCCLLPVEMREKALVDAIVKLGKEDLPMRAHIRNALDEMIQRKMQLFPDDRRLIADYRAYEKAGKYQFDVMSEPRHVPLDEPKIPPPAQPPAQAPPAAAPGP